MATKKKAKFEDSFKARVIVEDEEYVNICGHTVGTSASILKKSPLTL